MRPCAIRGGRAEFRPFLMMSQQEVHMSNQRSERAGAPGELESSKLPYERPVLTVHGDLGQLTQAKGMNGTNFDGALATNNKTL